MSTITNLKSVRDYNDYLEVETMHPLVNVVDMSELQHIRHGLKSFGFYCIYLKLSDCGTVLYGRKNTEYGDGSMMFVAPGQVAGVDDDNVALYPKGWILMFHPDLLYGTALARHIGDYAFFAYASSEALRISEAERRILVTCLQGIQREVQRPADQYSRRIIVSQIELVLNHCSRFFDRQFQPTESTSRDVLTRFEDILNNYFTSDNPQLYGLPTVGWCAAQLNFSPNYFGDLIKKQTGTSAQEHIRRTIIDRAKLLLTDRRKSISETAYALGFKYPHHLSRLFKNSEGVTPATFRAEHRNKR